MPPLAPTLGRGPALCEGSGTTKHRTIVCVTAIVLFALMAMSTAEAVNPVKSALVSGGERLRDLQNADGGWDFFAGTQDCGVGVSCPNTFGVTGLGLLASNHAKRVRSVRAASIDTGVALVAFFTAAPAGDGDPSTSADRPYSQDIEFLMALSHTKGVPGRSTYKDAAKAWFANTMGDFAVADDRVTQRIAGRTEQGIANLVGWDVASEIRAALETGNRAYAKALALAIVARASEWNFADPDCVGCELYSMGSLIWAIQVDGLRGDSTLRAAAKSYRDTLLGLQALDGSWNGDTQLTAYVVLGFGELSESKAVNKAIKKAVTFLLSMAIGNGGFGVGVGFETLENTEVNSEVLQALEAGLDDHHDGDDDDHHADDGDDHEDDGDDD